MKSTKLTSKNISSLLDSDDELPDSYCEETFELPAYLNDSRFDLIDLPWLNNCKPKPIQITKQQKPAEEISKPIKIKNEKSKVLISKGILTKRDLFFVRSIEDYCSEATLIWFIESLKSKCVSDRFHQSCLASDFLDPDFRNNQNCLFNNFEFKYYFNLVASM